MRSLARTRGGVASSLGRRSRSRELLPPVRRAGVRLADATAAVERLRAAVWAARPGEGWLPADLDVFDLVQDSIARWVTDLGDSLSRLTDSIEKARADRDVRSVEAALIAAVSARDKLRVIAVRMLGAKSIAPYKKGVRLMPSEPDLRRLLGELAAEGIAAAGLAKRLFEQLAEHPAVTLRNDVIHALAPFPELTDVCWIKEARLDENGQIMSWGRGPLYPEGSLDQGRAPRRFGRDNQDRRDSRGRGVARRPRARRGSPRPTNADRRRGGGRPRRPPARPASGSPTSGAGTRKGRSTCTSSAFAITSARCSGGSGSPRSRLTTCGGWSTS
jgi:hypothetical protein